MQPGGLNSRPRKRLGCRTPERCYADARWRERPLKCCTSNLNLLPFWHRCQSRMACSSRTASPSRPHHNSHCEEVLTQ